VVARANATPDPARTLHRDAAQTRDLLTPREREVTVLIAQGWRTNQQIAERLVIAEGTAGVHVQNVLHKLGLHSRWQIRERVAKQDPP